MRRLAGDKVKVTVLYPPTASPPSPLPPALLATFERLAAAQWPGVPVTPVMEAGATDGMHTRLAGIPTYAPSALPEDPDDVRAHGKDERVGVEAFYQATEFWYRMIKSLRRRPVTALSRPAAGDYDPAAAGYIALAPEITDAVSQLISQRDAVGRRLSVVNATAAGHRYAPGKWSVREVVGHLL